ncbi:helix-turn-helix transcriptional regulator [Hydrogenovibrio marinus]|uniref:AlpA family transcriptional regulator n=1 Tax=Hydrogenovibrio marinus TaxID=28885 RepID=A0A066ZRH0_HYDMR|nr:AlpA family transcriptional regulator [Hydrogenovibrio marinus]KDN94869.1 hypothetical protein EI16_00705 [Hydrogenovibrio marinus]BBN59334.1 transcriptional regulator [Hydrogenovibrio marinus]
MQKLLRLKQVMAETGLSRSYVYALSKDGKFPKPVKLSEKSVAWIESEIKEWIDQKIIDRNQGLA